MDRYISPYPIRTVILNPKFDPTFCPVRSAIRLDKESEVDTGNSSKTHDGVSSSIDTLDREPCMSVSFHEQQTSLTTRAKSLTLAHIPHQMPNSIVRMQRKSPS